MGLSRKAPKVFYGWWIVGAGFLIVLYMGGVTIYGFTAFFQPIANEFGWSYTQVSFAASLRGMETGLLAPIVGLMVDRWGSRRLIFLGAILSGLGFMLLSRVTSLPMFYGAFAVMAVGISACTGSVLLAPLAHWFHKKVGIATGIMLCGFGLGGLLVPLIVNFIDIYEWRMTALILGLGMVAIVLPLSLLVRSKPERYGYLPDGEARSPAMVSKGSVLTPSVETGFGIKQAMKSRAYWHIQVSLIFQMTALSAVTAHVMPYLNSVGIVRATAGLVAMGSPLLSIGGRLGFGWLADKFDRRYVTAGTFVMMSLGLLFFGNISEGVIWLILPFLFFFGSGYGGARVLAPILAREFFGRRNFATIIGFMLGISQLGNVAGPPLAGWVFDTWGAYQGLWLVFAGLMVAAFFSIVTTPSASTNRAGLRPQ